MARSVMVRLLALIGRKFQVGKTWYWGGGLSGRGVKLKGTTLAKSSFEEKIADLDR